jgi:hypothetical protein
MEHFRREALPQPAPVSRTESKSLASRWLTPKLLAIVVLVLLLAAAVGTAAYYINRYNDSQQQVNKLKANPTVAAQTEAQTLISQIGKLTDLPQGETPTVATVTDITKLKDQPFFTNAKNGDKVLIYTTAKKAYLYRPSTNKLINIAPVNLGSGQSNGTTSNTSGNQKP